jgi:hypothetical protein
LLAWTAAHKAVSLGTRSYKTHSDDTTHTQAPCPSHMHTTEDGAFPYRLQESIMPVAALPLFISKRLWWWQMTLPRLLLPLTPRQCLTLVTVPSAPDIRITTRFSPKVPKAGGHVTVTVKLWASTSAVPASLVVQVPNGLDLVKAPRNKRGEASFYSVYDDLDDEHMLVWENISLSRTDRKPQIFRFKLRTFE